MEVVYQFNAPAAVHRGKFREFNNLFAYLESCAYGGVSIKL